jgi:phosphocarrier protein
MKTFKYTITDELGIHARPAGMLAKTIKTFNSTVNIEKNGKEALATKIFAVMGLGARQNDTVTVTVEGPDEEAAAQAIETFFNDNL